MTPAEQQFVAELAEWLEDTLGQSRPVDAAHDFTKHLARKHLRIDLKEIPHVRRP